MENTRQPIPVVSSNSQNPSCNPRFQGLKINAERNLLQPYPRFGAWGFLHYSRHAASLQNDEHPDKNAQEEQTERAWGFPSAILPGSHNPYMGVSQNYGYLLGGPNNKDYSILGSILGSPYFGKLPYTPNIIYSPMYSLLSPVLISNSQACSLSQPKSRIASLPCAGCDHPPARAPGPHFDPKR